VTGVVLKAYHPIPVGIIFSSSGFPLVRALTLKKRSFPANSVLPWAKQVAPSLEPRHYFWGAEYALHIKMYFDHLVIDVPNPDFPKNKVKSSAFWEISSMLNFNLIKIHAHLNKYSIRLHFLSKPHV
jgi:hypothetical protein